MAFYLYWYFTFITFSHELCDNELFKIINVVIDKARSIWVKIMATKKKSSKANFPFVKLRTKTPSLCQWKWDCEMLIICYQLLWPINWQTCVANTLAFGLCVPGGKADSNKLEFSNSWVGHLSIGEALVSDLSTLWLYNMTSLDPTKTNFMC